jgi:hypothetical protein
MFTSVRDNCIKNPEKLVDDFLKAEKSEFETKKQVFEFARKALYRKLYEFAKKPHKFPVKIQQF